MISSGRKLIEATAKALNRKHTHNGLDFWKNEVVAYVEAKDINSFSIEVDELVSIIEEIVENRELSKSIAAIEIAKKEEIRDYVIDFQSHVAEQKWKRGRNI